MTPTPKLRFVERDSYSRNGEHFVMPLKIRVLQQWWQVEDIAYAWHTNGPDGEWRDVPLEKEQ
jgi:hypothetical protein